MNPVTRIGIRAAPRIRAPARIAPILLRRGAVTAPASKSTEQSSKPDSLLVAQRLRRPVAPHLTIYKVEQTWFGASAWTRITGCAMSGVLYLYASAYVVAPLVGWHIESVSVAAAFGALPFVVKAMVKSVAAFPFVFHFINGLRHLTWDMAVGFKKPQIWWSGSIIFGASVAGALGLAFLY